MSQPAFLDGVRVLDITNALAGPYCTTILSDLGAEVIKVEPTGGDGMRGRLMGEGSLALPFDLIHRGKGSVAVDLKAPEGCEIVRRLAGTADVLVENFRAGALAGLGLGYEDLRVVCPDLVYCSISGFGQFGPMRDAKGIDLIAQAYGGLLSVTGAEDGRLAKAGYPVSDLGSGMWGAVGVLAALLRARSGGGGSFVDISLADTVAAWSVWEVADYVATGQVPGPLGTAHRLAAPYQAFDCADGKMLVIGVVSRSWPRLCALLGVDVGGDGRFGDEVSRFTHREALAEILSAAFLRADRDDWIVRLREAGIPAGPVNSIADILTDEHYAARGIFLHERDRFGQPTIVNTPVVADGAPRARGRAPALGESTVGLLREVGYEPAVIDRLAETGVITTTDPGHPPPAGQAGGGHGAADQRGARR